MWFFSKSRPVDPEAPYPAALRCSWCGSGDTIPHGSTSLHYCLRCHRFFRAVPEIPFDAVADEWTAALGALQAAGEIIAVPLPEGFYGICVVSVRVERSTGRPAAPGPRGRRAAPARSAPGAHLHRLAP